MIAFVAGRLVQAAGALLLLSLLVFATTRLTGDPIRLMLPMTATTEDYERLRTARGLDQPVVIQYFIFVGDLVQGDLGRSIRSGEPVGKMLLERLQASAGLGLTALAVAYLVGVPLGILSAIHTRTRLDLAIRLIAVFGQSVPAFWLGILLVQLFAVTLRWLPSGTDSSPTHWILPVATLSAFSIAAVTRLVRSAMLEISDSEFVKFARSKGVRESTVVWKHMLRNALLPVVSFTSVLFVTYITAGIVVETVFAWPGIGSLAYSAILSRDFPVTQGIVLLAGTLAIAVAFIADIAYVMLDPRIRYAR